MSSDRKRATSKDRGSEPKSRRDLHQNKSRADSDDRGTTSDHGPNGSKVNLDFAMK
jgi:hypothetical protein